MLYYYGVAISHMTSRARALLKTLTIFTLTPVRKLSIIIIIIIIIMVTIIYSLLDLLLAAHVRSVVSSALSVRLDGRYRRNYITHYIGTFGVRCREITDCLHRHHNIIIWLPRRSAAV